MKKIVIILFVIFQTSAFCQGIEKQLVFTDTIQSKFLNESKLIHIYLPPDYYSSNDTYPLQVVLGYYSRTRMYYSISDYLSRTYHMFELNQLHTIPESIVVSVGNPNSKNMSEYNKFIVQEVIPLINKKYRKSHFKTIIGHSIGGELVLHSILDENSPFHAFYSSAPVNSDYFIKELSSEDKLSSLRKSKKRLFLAASQKDYFYVGNAKLINTFNKIDSETFLFKSTLKSSDNHHTIFPVTITDALFFIFKDWKFTIPEKDTANMTALFLKHYNQLSEKVGIEISPPEFDFYLLAYILNERGQTEEKIELLEKCKKLYPKAMNADAYLARTYYSIGDLQNAKIYNDYSLLLNPKNEFAKETKKLIEKKK
jgi:Putative esterase